MSKQVRLDKLLSNMGYGTRKEIDALARRNHIEMNGSLLKRGTDKVLLSPDEAGRIKLDGEIIDPLPGFAIMLNKPVGVTCSRKDSGTLIHDLLPPRWSLRDPALSTVGRLDKETSGLIILTDDGQLNHRITTPKSDTPKRYHVMIDRPLNGTESTVFASGQLMLEGETKPLLPAQIEVLGEKEAILTLHEGRYHQVRRMFASQGNHVTALHRLSIGGLRLPDDLEQGQWRMLCDDDIKAIFHLD